MTADGGALAACCIVGLCRKSTDRTVLVVPAQVEEEDIEPVKRDPPRVWGLTEVEASVNSCSTLTLTVPSSFV
jgi:hypothetical protein